MSGDKDRDQEDATDEGRSAQEPAEGADDKPPPEEGSPDSGSKQ